MISSTAALWFHSTLFSAAVQEMSSIKGLQKLCSERWKSSCGSCWITAIKSRSLTNGNDTLHSVCSSQINPWENLDFSVIFYNNIWIHVHVLYLKVKLKQKTQLCVTEPTAERGRLRLALLNKKVELCLTCFWEKQMCCLSVISAHYFSKIKIKLWTVQSGGCL